MSDNTTNTTEKQSDLMLWIAAGAVATIAIAWFAVSKLGSGSTTGSESAGPDLAVLVPELAGEESAEAAGAQAPDASAAASGSTLDNPLRAAEMAYEAGMLTEPENYSAWTLFGAVLESDPSSEAARQGLERVAGDLLTRGTSAVEQGRYADATAIADRVLARLPAHSGAEALKQSIVDAEARRREREAARVAAPPARAEQPNVASGSISAPSVEREAAAPRGPSRDELLDTYHEGFEAAVAGNQLLAPADESAKYFVLEMRELDAGDDRTVAAADWLISEMLGRSRQATEATDFAAAQTWLDEAEGLGAPSAALVEHRSGLVSAMAAAESAKRLPVAELKLTEYVPPLYPRTALSRGIEGWVDLNFRVTAGGTTTDVTVTDASHERMFQNEAVDAVQQWTFEPRTFMGMTIDQNTYTRVRFILSDD